MYIVSAGFSARPTPTATARTSMAHCSSLSTYWRRQIGPGFLAGIKAPGSASQGLDWLGGLSSRVRKVLGALSAFSPEYAYTTRHCNETMVHPARCGVGVDRAASHASTSNNRYYKNHVWSVRCRSTDGRKYPLQMAERLRKWRAP